MDETLLGKRGYYCGQCPSFIAGECTGCIKGNTIFLEINIGVGAEASFGINGSKVGITPGVGATVGMIVVTDEEEINKKRGMQ